MSKHQELLDQWKKRVLRRARAKLGVRTARIATILHHIRLVHHDAPEVITLRRYQLLEWWCNNGRHQASIHARIHWKPSSGSDAFLNSREWRRLRMEVLKERGARCECCGAGAADGITVINVDHIKPRRHHPELALERANLQVLCSQCNAGKGNWDETDWRMMSPSSTLRPRLVKRRQTRNSDRSDPDAAEIRIRTLEGDGRD